MPNIQKFPSDCLGRFQVTSAGLTSRREALSCRASGASCPGVCVSSLGCRNSVPVKTWFIYKNVTLRESQRLMPERRCCSVPSYCV